MRYERLKEFGPHRWTPPVRPHPKSFMLECCDCALTHEFKFYVVNGDVEFVIRQKPRLTAQARRRRGTGLRTLFARILARLT